VNNEHPEEIELIKKQEDLKARDVDQECFKNIRLLSYNIFIRPPAPKFTHNVDDDFKDQRLTSFMETYLDNYDIVCLQEMFGSFSRRRRRLVRAAKKRGFNWKVSSPQSRSKMFLVDGGCLILSRVKIVSHSSTIFSPGMMSDRLAAKGVIYAKLEPQPSVYVHLFVTHLQAVYSGSETMGECLSVQRDQYDELVDFIANIIAENESPEDMLIAKRLTEKKRRGIASVGPSSPEPLSSLSQITRRWPIVLAGDFNCNSRPCAGEPLSYVSDQYQSLSSSLSKLGSFSDVLLDTIGEHPVTYAAANFSPDGSSFSPVETALTAPEDYEESGQYVNQSLDYVFLFPPSHELLQPAKCGHTISRGMSLQTTGVDKENTREPLKFIIGSPVISRPDSAVLSPRGQSVPRMEMMKEPLSPESRAIRQSVVRPSSAAVKHLEYVGNPRNPKLAVPKSLKYLSDHLAIETVFRVNGEPLSPPPNPVDQL
jgi:endonuclease/exonuclease/phosphatase family metal-dependent hydrolase